MTNQSTTQNYAAYGLAIRSSIPLTEFATAEETGRAADVVVTRGRELPQCSSNRRENGYIVVSRDEFRFWFKGLGELIVTGGSRVTAIPDEASDESQLRIFIQGMLMAAVLYQRGVCVLHASVVEIDGSAVAFLGSYGMGKSSLAAALHCRGHRVLTDDNAAIQFTSEGPLVVPSYPSVKLFPEIASALGFSNGSLTVLPSSPKVARAVEKGFVREPRPLRGLYFLGRDYETEIAALGPLQAAMELVFNSVPTRWGHRGDAQHLQQCSQIAGHVPANTLKTFGDLASLPKLAETVENHLVGGGLIRTRKVLNPRRKEVIHDGTRFN